MGSWDGWVWVQFPSATLLGYGEVLSMWDKKECPLCGREFLERRFRGDDNAKGTILLNCFITHTYEKYCQVFTPYMIRASFCGSCAIVEGKGAGGGGITPERSVSSS